MVNYVGSPKTATSLGVLIPETVNACLELCLAPIEWQPRSHLEPVVSNIDAKRLIIEIIIGPGTIGCREVHIKKENHKILSQSRTLLHARNRAVHSGYPIDA